MATPSAVAQALPALQQATNTLRAAGNEQSLALAAALDQIAGAIINTQTQLATHVQDNLQAHDSLQGLINGLQGEVATLRTQHDGLQTALTERFVPLETRVTAVEATLQATSNLEQRITANEQQTATLSSQLTGVALNASNALAKVIDLSNAVAAAGGVVPTATPDEDGARQSGRALSANEGIKAIGKHGGGAP